MSDPATSLVEPDETLVSDDEKLVIKETDEGLFFSPRREVRRYFKLTPYSISSFSKMGEPYQIGLLPPNVAWISPNHRHLIMVEEPSFRRITLRHMIAPTCECVWGRDENNDEILEETCVLCGQGHPDDALEVHQGNAPGWSEYLIPFPWITYVFDTAPRSVTLKRIMASNHDPRSDNYMSGLPLPNVYASGELCAGRTSLEHYIHNERSKHRGVSFLVGLCLENFWSSAFNYDVMHYKTHPVWVQIRETVKMYWNDPHVFQEWEKKTIEEVLTLPWDQPNPERLHGSVARLSDIIANHSGEKSLLDFERTILRTAMDNRDW